MDHGEVGSPRGTGGLPEGGTGDTGEGFRGPCERRRDV